MHTGDKIPAEIISSAGNLANSIELHEERWPNGEADKSPNGDTPNAILNRTIRKKPASIVRPTRNVQGVTGGRER